MYRSCICCSGDINPQRQGKRTEEQLHYCSQQFPLSLQRLAGRLSSAVCVRGRGWPQHVLPGPAHLRHWGLLFRFAQQGLPHIHTQAEANLPSRTPLAKWFLWICGSQTRRHNELKLTPVRHLLPQETILPFCSTSLCPRFLLTFFSWLNLLSVKMYPL